MLKYILTFFSLIYLSPLTAQVFSPDLLCVRNDTLYWDIPVNSCGSFNSYDIFTSENEAGPYTLLTQITDENQTDFYHVNTGGIFYYYLAGNYDCPGENVIFSDTLDNLQPPRIVINHVTVVGEDTEVNWTAGTVPEIIGYIIFRETSVGVVPIDTVFGNTVTYTDPTADPTEQAESYFVLALDNCGGTSVFDEEHRTVHLTANAVECTDFINLTWSPYVGWEEGVEKYEILLSVNGEPAESVAEVSGDSTKYDLPQPTVMSDYCFYVRATEAGGADVSASNEICLSVNVVQPERNFAFTNISVNPDNSVGINWVWNEDAQITAYDINRGTSETDLTSVLTQEITEPLSFFNDYTDPDADPNAGPVFYSVTAGDECGNNSSTGAASTIFLQGNTDENAVNNLRWTAFSVANATVANYEIYLFKDGLSFLVGTVNAGSVQFSHAIETQVDEPVACYYVTAVATVSLFDGSERTVRSRSNTICIEQNTRLFLPNAFAPNGVNKEFRAVVLFPETVAFQMELYDRYGRQIFRTSDVNEGWNGEIDGELAAQGIYVYHARVTQTNGRVVEKQGTFLLVK